MPFITGLGDPLSGLTSTITAGAPSLLTGVWEQTPFLDVSANGTSLPNTLQATIVIALDATVSTCTIDLTEDPGVPQNADIVVTCGAGLNNRARFHGQVKRKRANLWPHTFSLICRGRLSLADKYKQSVGAALPTFVVNQLNSRLPIVGISMTDILNGADATDQNYVVGVLNRVPGLDFDPADIGGTGHIFGLAAYRDLIWSPYVSALAQCQKLDEVCLGFRLFEGLNGRILRKQVFGYPTNVSDATFTEGLDIWDASGERSIEDLANAVYVEGYLFGGNQGIISSYLAEDNDFQSADNPTIQPFSSTLIEDFDFADQVAAWKLAESNRELVDLELTTFRDDMLWPGRTITINSPHSGVNGEPVWIQRVQIQARNSPVLFQQTISGRGGGLAGGSGIGSYTPPDVGNL